MKRAVFLATLMLLAGCQQQGPKAEQPASQPAESKAAGKPEGKSDGGQPLHGRFDTQFAGTPAPDIPLETGPDGATETIADIVKANPGKPVLVNLWATWCAPCLIELPTLDRLAADTRGKLVVVPVSQDMEGWRKVSKAFTPAKYPNLSTRLESQMQFGFKLGARGLPLTILYDAQGKEVWRYAGDRDWSAPDSRARIGV
jgi:thiol-disulfide isomerase/thioredoxin